MQRSSPYGYTEEERAAEEAKEEAIGDEAE
jgi:hypothetical protein